MTDPVVLPDLLWLPSEGFGARQGSPVRRVVIHRWGNRYPADEVKTFKGVVSFLRKKESRASAHVVHEGSKVKPAQLVRWSDYAWTEAAFNPTSVEIETADHFWVRDAAGHYHDPTGFRQLARMAAWMLATGGGLHPPSKHVLPPVWSHDHGLCRHADLGHAGGGHTQCPTTDLARWREFVKLVQAEYHRGGFREHWGRR